MRRNFKFDTISTALPSLFRALLEEGVSVPSRNGDTMELPFTGITIEDGTAREIMVPGRKHNLAAQIAETMWVLSGRNDIEWLSHYLPRAADYSDDGVVWRGGYGPRIRYWVNYPEDTVDQLGHVVDLLRTTPDTRQAVIGIYDPAIDTRPGKDIPCNDFLHFLSRGGMLDLHVFVRSNDAMWGWSGINVFEWSSLLEIVAGMTGLGVGAVHFSVSSFHLYEQHFAKARQIADMPGVLQANADSPRFDPTGLDDMESFHELTHMWFEAERAIRQQAERPASERNLWDMIENFPEPMMQSWLRVLAWWWTGENHYILPLAGTNLGVSASMALQPKTTLAAVPDEKPLIDQIVALHNEKDAAYGDSWCKRGEMLGIMANIARKIDRLGGAETSDETSLDTAMDLFVYLGKYRAWIDNRQIPERDLANQMLMAAASAGLPEFQEQADLYDRLRDQFDFLEEAVMAGDMPNRNIIVSRMLRDAWDLVATMAAK